MLYKIPVFDFDEMAVEREHNENITIFRIVHDSVQ